MKKAVDINSLASKTCAPCEGGVAPLSQGSIDENLASLHGWQYLDGKISKDYQFPNYYETMAFVNAVAWIANSEGHHPDLEVGYGNCRVSLWTHAIKGMSENDFIVAAKIEKLLLLP